MGNSNTVRCGLDGCESRQCEELGSHVWSQQVVAVSGCLPTEAPIETKYVSFWVDIDDRERRPAEIMLGLYHDINGHNGVEAWLTAEEAERLRYLLGSAIRRHTGYRAVAQ